MIRLAQLEAHDPAILAHARALLDACHTPQEMQEAVLTALVRNEAWRGMQCLNLLAPGTPTRPTVRATLRQGGHPCHRGAYWPGEPLWQPRLFVRNELCCASEPSREDPLSEHFHW